MPETVFTHSDFSSAVYDNHPDGAFGSPVRPGRMCRVIDIRNKTSELGSMRTRDQLADLKVLVIHSWCPVSGRAFGYSVGDFCGREAISNRWW